MSDTLSRAQAAYRDFTRDFRSVVLATVDDKGEPNASYAPFVMDEQRRIHCFLSGLSVHTGNLEKTGKASALFLEDEAAAEQVFARRRLTYACDAEFLPREHPDHDAVAELFRRRFPEMGERLLSMPDFRPVRLTPRSGTFVIGFGAAFAIQGDDLDTLVHQTGGAGGHGHGGGARGHAPDHAGEGSGAGGRGHGAPAPVEAPASDVADDGSLPSDAVQRMVDHMNADHVEALVNYARHYGGRGDVTEARLLDVDAQGMELSVTADDGSRTQLRIPFEKPLGHSGDAHHVLVQMAIEARKQLEAARSRR